jgi:hypothetical protein
VHDRDSERFWEAISRVREDVLPGELRVSGWRGEGGVSWRILEGDCRDVLASLEPGSVQTVRDVAAVLRLAGLRHGRVGGRRSGVRSPRHGATVRRPRRSKRGNARIPAERLRSVTKNEVPYRDECGKCGARRVDRQIGLEPSPDEFVQALVGVFREVRRVLRDDGTVWLNLGD